MRLVKPATALTLSLVCSAVLATVASAAETLVKLLPGAKGTTFTGKSGKATLQIKGGGAITCKSSATEGEITEEATLGLETIHYTGCTTAGLPINSLGDASGITLSHAELHFCHIIGPIYIWRRTRLPLHLEVPSTKLLVTVEGSDLAEVTPNKTVTKTFTLGVSQKEGKQNVEKCEGGEAQTLKTSLDGGAFIQSADEESEASVTFAVAQEAMA
jgi:hypothetical protein